MKLINAKFIKKHLALAIVIVIIVTLFGSLHMLTTLSLKSTLELETLEGDMSALHDVLITGELSDGCYTTPFNIENGSLNYTTSYITRANQDHRYTLGTTPIYNSLNATLYDTYSFYLHPIFASSQHNNGQILNIVPTNSFYANDFASLDNDSKYLTVTQKVDAANLHISLSVFGFHNKFDFSTPKISNFEDGDNVYFDTGISMKRAKADIILKENYLCPDINAIPTDNVLPSHAILKDQEYTLPFNIDNLSSGITVINDTVYFIPPVSSNFSGTASLYRIESFAPHTFHMLKEESILDTLGTITSIYNVNLDAHDTSILGLENVNDYLVLILMKHNQLVFQTINPTNGALISESTTDVLPNSNISYNYIPFFAEDSLSLILYSDSTHSFLIGISIDANGQINAMSSVISNANTNSNYHSSFLTFVNNKLFLFEPMKDSKAFYGPTYVVASTYNEQVETTTSRTTIVEDDSLVLSVYEDNTLLYKGKFITDSFEDQVFLKESNRLNNTFSSDCIFRSFNSLSVKGVSYYDRTKKRN